MNQNTTKENTSHCGLLPETHISRNPITTRKNTPSQFTGLHAELLEKLEQERCEIQSSIRKINNALNRFHEPDLSHDDFQFWEAGKNSVWEMTRAVDALSEVIAGLVQLPPETEQ